MPMSLKIPKGQEDRFYRALRVALLSREHIPVPRGPISNEELHAYLDDRLKNDDDTIRDCVIVIMENINSGQNINFEWIENDDFRQKDFAIQSLTRFFRSKKMGFLRNIGERNIQKVITANLDNLPLDTTDKIFIGIHTKKLWERVNIFERAFYKWLKERRTGGKIPKFEYSVRYVNRTYPQFRIRSFESNDEGIEKFAQAIFRIHLITEDLFGDIKTSYSGTSKRKKSTQKSPQLNVQVSHKTKEQLDKFLENKKETGDKETQNSFVERAIITLMRQEEGKIHYRLPRFFGITSAKR